MCGIIGYVGKNNSTSYIIDGLKKLEYRGYDSAGISILQDDKIITVRAVGKVAELEKAALLINPQGDLVVVAGIVFLLLVNRQQRIPHE